MHIRNLIIALTFLLIACGEDKKPQIKSPKELTTYNVLSYLNAHPIIDTSKVIIPNNYYNLIAVKSQEKKLFETWLTNHNNKESEDNIFSIWSQFGDVMDLITLEFKIIQSLGLNPRIVFFKKEEYYRNLELPFAPFANTTLFEVLQNQLLFAQDLIDNYSREEIEAKLDVFFETHPGFTNEDEEAMRFDLFRWYIMKEEGFIRNSKRVRKDKK